MLRTASVPPLFPYATLFRSGPAGCDPEFPLPDAVRSTVTPLIGVPLASLTVTVIVDVSLLPATIELGEAVTVDCRSEEHTSELQSPCNLVCRFLLEKNTIQD